MDIDFDAALLRLKGVLKVRTDKEVAARIGMSATALNERKKRNSFPADKVRALAAKELFDSDYVLTGLAQTTREMIHAVKAGAPLVKATTQEQHLLTLWRSCAPADQKLLLEIASRLGQAPL